MISQLYDIVMIVVIIVSLIALPSSILTVGYLEEIEAFGLKEEEKG